MYNLLGIRSLTSCNLEMCFKDAQIWVISKQASKIDFISEILYLVDNYDSANVLLIVNNDIESMKCYNRPGHIGNIEGCAGQKSSLPAFLIRRICFFVTIVLLAKLQGSLMVKSNEHSCLLI